MTDVTVLDLLILAGHVKASSRRGQEAYQAAVRVLELIEDEDTHARIAVLHDGVQVASMCFPIIAPDLILDGSIGEWDYIPNYAGALGEDDEDDEP